MPEADISLLRRLVEEEFQNEALFQQIYSECIYHEASGKTLRAEQVLDFRNAFARAFSGVRGRIEHCLVHGEHVWMHWIFNGKHTGEFGGVPATGREISCPIMTLSRMEHEKVVEEWEVADIAGLMQQIGSTVAATEANKTTVRLAFDLLNGRGLERCHEIYAPEVACHHTGVPDMTGLDARAAFLRMIYTAVPDIHWEIDSLVAEGETVVARYHWIGRHDGDWLGIAPTGRTVSGSNTTIFRIVGGKIVEEHTESDILGLCRQLGALPPSFAAELHLTAA